MKMFPEFLSATSVFYFLLVAAGVSLGTLFARRKYLSPLSDIPGPFVASFTASWWHLWHIWKGHVEVAFTEQHHKHGRTALGGVTWSPYC